MFRDRDTVDLLLDRRERAVDRDGIEDVWDGAVLWELLNKSMCRLQDQSTDHQHTLTDRFMVSNAYESSLCVNGYISVSSDQIGGDGLSVTVATMSVSCCPSLSDFGLLRMSIKLGHGWPAHKAA